MESQESTPYQNSFLILLPRSPKIPYTDEFEDPRPNRLTAPRSSIRYTTNHLLFCALVTSCNHYIKMLVWMRGKRSNFKRAEVAAKHTRGDDDDK
jgi:hypothetical protein